MKKIICLILLLFVFSCEERNDIFKNLAPSDIDNICPTPGNLGEIEAKEIQETSITLKWTKAHDDYSPNGDILTYLVYQSDQPNIETIEAMLVQKNSLITEAVEIDNLKTTDLNPAEEYFFNIMVVDSAGNKAAYKMQNILTKEIIPPEENKTTVKIIYPIEGQIFTLTTGGNNSTLTIKAEALDLDGIQKVEFYLRNADGFEFLLGQCSLPPYSYDWILFGRYGTYTIKVIAYDIFNNKAMDEVLIYIKYETGSVATLP